MARKRNPKKMLWFPKPSVKLGADAPTPQAHERKLKKKETSPCHDKAHMLACACYNGAWGRCTKRRFNGRKEALTPCPGFIKRKDGPFIEDDTKGDY